MGFLNNITAMTRKRKELMIFVPAYSMIGVNGRKWSEAIVPNIIVNMKTVLFIPGYCTISPLVIHIINIYYFDNILIGT